MPLVIISILVQVPYIRAIINFHQPLTKINTQLLSKTVIETTSRLSISLIIKLPSSPFRFSRILCEVLST